MTYLQWWVTFHLSRECFHMNKKELVVCTFFFLVGENFMFDVRRIISHEYLTRSELLWMSSFISLRFSTHYDFFFGLFIHHIWFLMPPSVFEKKFLCQFNPNNIYFHLSIWSDLVCEWGNVIFFSSCYFRLI